MQRITKDVHPSETFCRGAHSRRMNRTGSEMAMKQILPLVLALIPLAAVVGACVAVP